MSITFQAYHHVRDSARVSQFLISHHQPGNADGNWLEPDWAYMHFHPAMQPEHLHKIGIWQAENGQIAAICHYEWRLGEAFFQFHPQYHHLRAEMLDYAETNLAETIAQKDTRRLCAYINATDPEFLALAQQRGYQHDPAGARPLYKFTIPHVLPAPALPAGFHLTSLAEDCDWGKVQRVLWLGFNHGEPVPMHPEELAARRQMFDTPTARRDLKIAVTAPNGDFVAFCGMFYQPENRFAYVEPVATDPRYRRLGLGKAAVLEGIRRCARLGASVAYVGSDQPFYQAIGFKPVYTSQCWVKHLGNMT